MVQEEINKDLDSYMKERKGKSFWKKVSFRTKSKPKESEEELQARVDAELKKDMKQDVEKMAEKEERQITLDDKAALEKEEHKIEAINEVEQDIEEDLEEKREGALKRFFKKLNFSKKKKDSTEDDAEEFTDEEASEIEEKEHTETVKDDEVPQFENEEEELKEVLRTVHTWIVQLPPEKLEEFKNSKDFKLYKKYLEKHNLIR